MYSFTSTNAILIQTFISDSELLKMKKKNYAENSEEDNEFDVDEPEEIQNNASDDDWTPDKDVSLINIKQRSPYILGPFNLYIYGKKGAFYYSNLQ